MTASIKHGTVLTIHDKRALVKVFDSTSRNIEVLTDEGISSVMPMSQFSELYSNGVIKLHDGDNEIEKNYGNGQDLAYLLLTKSQQLIIDRRLAYIRTAMTETGLWKKDTSERKNAARLYALEIHDSDAPSDYTILRWYRRYKLFKGDVRGLLPRAERKGNRDPRLCETVEQAMDHVIQKFYLKDDRHSAKFVFNYKLMTMLQDLGVSSEKWPSYTSFTKRIRQLPEYLKCQKRYGHHEASNSYPNGRPFPRAEFVQQRVEIDNTPVDINVIDSHGNIIGRVFVTFLIDCYSKMIVGFYVSIKNVSRRNILKGIVHAIKPKDYIKTKYPFLKNDWPCFGLFSQLVSDNGMDLLADDVKTALYSLGIDYTQHKKKTPRLKGVVERFIGTFNQVLVHQLPGTTFSNYQEKKDYKSSDKACITFEKLDELIHRWIVDVYHVEKHRGLNDTPLNVWKRSVKNYQAPSLPCSAEILDRILTENYERTLQKYGVEIFGLKYNSEALMNIARSKGYSVKLNVFYNPDNIAKIEVLDPDTNSYVEATCIHETYTGGFLSLEDHEATKSAARKAAGHNKMLSEKQLIRSRAEIDAEIAKCRIINEQRRKKPSKLHKHDTERKKTSGSVNGSDKAADVKKSTILNDDRISKTVKLTFAAFE